MEGVSIGRPQDSSPYSAQPLFAHVDLPSCLSLPTYHPEHVPEYDADDLYIYPQDISDDSSYRSGSTCSTCSITRERAERLKDTRPAPAPYAAPLPPLAPLQDSYSRYFGGSHLASGVTKDNAWLKQYSARVTDVAACCLPGPSNYAGKARVRVAVGCEDGVIRIFAGTDDPEVEGVMEIARMKTVDDSQEVLADSEVRTIRGSPSPTSPSRTGRSGSARALSPGSPTRSLMRLGLSAANGSSARERSVSIASASTSRSVFSSQPSPARTRPTTKRSQSRDSSLTNGHPHHEDPAVPTKAPPTVSVSELDAAAEIPTSPRLPTAGKSRRKHAQRPSISISALNAVTVPSSEPLLEGLRRISSSASERDQDTTPPSPPSPASPAKRPGIYSARSTSSTFSLMSQASPGLDPPISFSSLDGRPSIDFSLAEESAPDPWEDLQLQHVLDVKLNGQGSSIVALQIVDHALDSCSQDEEVSEGRAIVCLTDAGRLFKVSLVDGHCFALAELGKAEGSGLGFSGFHVLPTLRDAFVLCFAPSAGMCVPVRLSDFSALLPLSVPSPSRQMAVLFSGEDPHLLSLPLDGLATLAALTCSDGGVALGSAVAIQDSGLKRPAETFRIEGNRVAVWNDSELQIWDISGGQISRRIAIDVPRQDSIAGMRFLDPSVLLVQYESQLSVLAVSVDDDGGLSVSPKAMTPLDGVEFCSKTNPSTMGTHFIVAVQPFGRTRSLELASYERVSITIPRKSKMRKDALKMRALFTPPELPPPELGAVAVTSALYHDQTLFVGDSEGGLTTFRMCTTDGAAPCWDRIAQTDHRLSGAIVRTHVSVDVVITGTTSGWIGAWSKDGLRFRTEDTLAFSPISRISRLGKDGMHPKLKGAFVCAGEDGNVAFVSLGPRGFTEILGVPSSKSSLQEVWVKGEQVLVTYENGMAEEWDILQEGVQRELTASEAAESLSGPEPWHLVSWGADELVGAPSGYLSQPTTSSALLVPLRSLADQAADPKSDLETLLQSSRMALAQLSPSKDLAEDALTRLCGVDDDDKRWPSTEHASTTCTTSATTSPLSSSPRCTATRLLCLCVLVRTFLNDPTLERLAGEGMLHLTHILDNREPSFKPPSLDVLARFWLDRSSEVREAARLLFGASLSRLSDAALRRLAERWQPRLLVNASLRTSQADQAEAMLLVGLIASEKYKLLSSTLLKDLAATIVASLDTEVPPYNRAVAIELCSRAFQIFQHFIDAMDLVRSLFGLATGRDPRTSSDLRAMARHAVLHVAAVNTPLFMTTLSYDLVTAREASHRIATMKLVAFMVRKKPRVLHTSLPRLAEAVVKSLDPTHKVLREATQSATTVILHELVKTYPSIAFHGRTQRLAVGTAEGAVIVYDVKTATRLYVLGGHKKPVTVCSFSPDGHRLVTVSLEEGRAEVWKVAVGMLAYLTPGAPPRQGGLGSLIGSGSSAGPASPYKIFPFNVGEEGNMSTAATLEWVTIEWPGERSCRLRIRESALTFAV